MSANRRQPPPSSFNLAYNGISRVITTAVRIGEAFSLGTSIPKPPEIEYQAIWDTGATQTAITKKVAADCGLKPTGMCKVSTASGEVDTCTYFVSLYLPNRVCLPQVRATEAILRGADVLIGMDVITRGDFVITNHQGKTNVSFRMPSLECIDFVKTEPPVIDIDGQIYRKVGRNELCPCGSGKKFKRCHGK